MASLPYISAAGNIEKALNAIRAAAVPERVSQDFVKTVLKIPGGSGDQITTYLKKLGFSSPDGRPTETYTRFRNPTTSGQTLAAAIKHAYARLYMRNEYMHSLNDNDLQGLIVEETGQAHDSLSVKRTLACINALKNMVNFDEPTTVPPEITDEPQQGTKSVDSQPVNYVPLPHGQNGSVGLNLGYTINLNLPATSDPAVFNAIFKSLKEHSLRDDDG